MCLIATIVASFHKAGQILEDRGVHIDAKTICEITRRYAPRAEPMAVGFGYAIKNVAPKRRRDGIITRPNGVNPNCS
jgi:hypothetical protein